jgi:hypothetical protein
MFPPCPHTPPNKHNLSKYLAMSIAAQAVEIESESEEQEEEQEEDVAEICISNSYFLHKGYSLIDFSIRLMIHS